MSEPVQAAYVHLPFCQSKCQYCDFVSWSGCLDQIPAYLQAVQQEMMAVSRWSRDSGLARPLTNVSGQPLTSVFFGGGTPTMVPAAGLASLLARLADCFGLSPAAEVTLEANPGTVTPASLASLRAARFNRISFGLQAAQPHLLKALGRIHTAAEFVSSVQAAQAAGFSRINADIMLGLPGQTLADVQETLDLLAGLPVGHVSFYSLIVEPDTPFYDRYADHPELLPDEDLERAMYHLVRSALAARGLQPYEISNAALPGEECQHNLVYWQARSYYGFGAAAHSYLAGLRRGNTPVLADYLAAWPPTAPGPARDPFPAVISSEVIDLAESQRETMLLGLRLDRGVDWTAFQHRFGTDARRLFATELADLAARGLVILDEAGVRLSLRGLDLANQVFMAFV
jgi:oxygen-independent coproporphyrinogen-3 oxidase